MLKLSTSFAHCQFSAIRIHRSFEMFVTDEEASELKTWVVKKLEDMYDLPRTI